MGMFDRVWVPCPECNTTVEFQSKAGECVLRNYSLQDAPTVILSDISNDTEGCPNCGHAFAAKDAPNWVEPDGELKRLRQVYMAARMVLRSGEPDEWKYLKDCIATYMKEYPEEE